MSLSFSCWEMSARLVLPACCPRCSLTVRLSCINEDRMRVVTTHTSHINRGMRQATHKGAGSLTSALLPQVFLLKVKTTHNETHFLTNALQSSTALYKQHCIIYSALWVVHLFWLSLALRQTRHGPGQTNQSWVEMFQGLSCLLLGLRLKCFPFCFYANLSGQTQNDTQSMNCQGGGRIKWLLSVMQK